MQRSEVCRTLQDSRAERGGKAEGSLSERIPPGDSGLRPTGGSTGEPYQGVCSACGSGALVYIVMPTAAGTMRDPRRSLDTNPA
jgi:hypothetical protein